MLTFPMPNTPEFGRRIYDIRTGELGVSQDKVADAGGPSGPQQSRVENGQEHPVSREFLTRYAAAAHTLQPGKFGDQAHSLFEALAAAHHAATDGLDGDRSQAIAQAARTALPGEMVLGVDLATDAIITAAAIGPAIQRAIALPSALSMGGAVSILGSPSDKTDGYLAGAAKSAEAEFLSSGYRIAARFRGITITNDDDVDITELTQKWTAAGGQTVQQSVTKRLDPIADVTTLSAAKKIALAFDAYAPQDLLATAWVILLANALGRRTGRSPIDAYHEYSDSPHYWEDIFNRLDARVRAELPSVRSMLNTAHKYLLPHIPSRSGSAVDWAVELAGSGTSISWNVDVPVDHQPLSPDAGDLWLAESSTVDHIARIMNCHNVSVIVFESRKYSSSGPWIHVMGTSSPMYGPSYRWAPAQIHDEHPYAFLRDDQAATWHAVQLY